MILMKPLDSTSNISFPDAPVAHAIYARAALTRQDYAVAKEHAALARANFPLMDTNTYYSGFCTPSSEWIWGVYNDASETMRSKISMYVSIVIWLSLLPTAIFVKDCS